jgi:hypothetical protein
VLDRSIVRRDVHLDSRVLFVRHSREGLEESRVHGGRGAGRDEVRISLSRGRVELVKLVVRRFGKVGRGVLMARVIGQGSGVGVGVGLVYVCVCDLGLSYLGDLRWGRLSRGFVGGRGDGLSDRRRLHMHLYRLVGARLFLGGVHRVLGASLSYECTVAFWSRLRLGRVGLDDLGDVGGVNGGN